MDQQSLTDETRSLLISELNISHLSEDEQQKVLDALSEMLMRRVMIKLMDMLPEAEQGNFAELLATQKAQEAQTVIQTFIPNHAEVITAELKAGIEEHKRLVAEAA